MMIFKKCGANTQVQVEVDGVQIERVREITFLGVTTDDKIGRTSHIKHVQSKIDSVSNRTEHLLDHKSLHILYSALVLLH